MGIVRMGISRLGIVVSSGSKLFFVKGIGVGGGRMGLKLQMNMAML